MKKWITGGAAVAAITAATVAAMTSGHSPTAARQTAAVNSAATARTAAASPVSILSPSAYRLKLKGQYQQTNYYCVPASGSMSLSTFGVTASQKTLATKMKTTAKHGTSGNDALPVLNSYVTSHGHRYTAVTDVYQHPTTLMSRVSYDVGSLHRAPVIGVWMEKLPWNKGKVHGTRIGHAMVVYGYDRSKNTITVFDPWKPTGGTHTLSAKALAGALENAGSMHYIARD